MANLNIALYNCVKSISKLSSCNKCEISCPVGAISINDLTPTIDQITCIDCGACISVCPTEAISLKNFSPLDLSFEIVENNNMIDCKVNTPCLSAISHEYLVAMAIFKGENIKCNLEHCSNCEIFSQVGRQIENQISEANLLLKAFNRDEEILIDNFENSQFLQKDNIEKERRKIFNVSNLKRDNSIFDTQTIEKLKEKGVPNRRKLFLMAVEKVKESHHILAREDLSTLSQKEINSDCTNCQICYRICPSKALSTDYKNSFINFEPHLCLKCNLCHDVCEVDSIQLLESFSIAKLQNRAKNKLIEFNISKCYECDGYFTKRGESNLCPRCEIEESEALALWT